MVDACVHARVTVNQARMKCTVGQLFTLLARVLLTDMVCHFNGQGRTTQHALF